jgi:hypothetical protein
MKTTTKKLVEGKIPICALYDAVCRELPVDRPVNVDITIFVDVPGGGDWSYEELDVDSHPVKFRATWTEVEGE